MSLRLRLWLRRNTWLWFSFALSLAIAGVVMTAFIMAGLWPARLYLVLWGMIPIGNGYIIWYLSAEADVFRQLLSRELREDVPAQQPR